MLRHITDNPQTFVLVVLDDGHYLRHFPLFSLGFCLGIYSLKIYRGDGTNDRMPARIEKISWKDLRDFFKGASNICQRRPSSKSG